MPARQRLAYHILSFFKCSFQLVIGVWYRPDMPMPHAIMKDHIETPDDGAGPQANTIMPMKIKAWWHQVYLAVAFRKPEVYYKLFRLRRPSSRIADTHGWQHDAVPECPRNGFLQWPSSFAESDEGSMQVPGGLQPSWVLCVCVCVLVLNKCWIVFGIESSCVLFFGSLLFHPLKMYPGLCCWSLRVDIG